MKHLILTGKFYFGVFLFILSLVLGKITTILFLLHPYDTLIKWSSIMVYIISWPMLFVGVWLVGNEYALQLKKYFSYRYHHKLAKKNTKKAVNSGKYMVKKTHQQVVRTHQHVSGKTKQLVNSVTKKSKSNKYKKVKK